MLHMSDLKKSEQTATRQQLLLDGRKCNASTSILFRDENDELCVVFQKVNRNENREWTVSAGKVEISDQNNIPEILKSMFEGKDLATFAHAAVREATEEQGYPLLNEVLEGKAKLYHFDRDANGMIEKDQKFRSEIFYAFVGKRSKDEIAKLIRAQGDRDSEEVRIVHASDVQIKNLENGRFECSLKGESIPVRVSTALLLQKIEKLKELTSTESSQSKLTGPR